MDEENYTSLELSKKLSEAGCELKSENMWVKYTLWKEPRIWSSDLSSNIKKTCLSGKREYEYPAYDILNDLCVKYAKEMFGEREKLSERNEMKIGGWACLHCGWATAVQPPKATGCNHVQFPDDCKTCKVKDTGWEKHTEKVFTLLQKGKKQEAEDYIWEHCLFNPDNQST